MIANGTVNSIKIDEGSTKLGRNGRPKRPSFVDWRRKKDRRVRLKRLSVVDWRRKSD
jgi:hypothetical protein